jgi:hypothetical protein
MAAGSYTFRYGLIHVGGSDHEDLRARFAIARSLLPFEFGHAQTAPRTRKVRADSAGA